MLKCERCNKTRADAIPVVVGKDGVLNQRVLCGECRAAVGLVYEVTLTPAGADMLAALAETVETVEAGPEEAAAADAPTGVSAPQDAAGVGLEESEAAAAPAPQDDRPPKRG